MRSIVTIFMLLTWLQGAAAQPNLNFKRVTVNWPTIELYFSAGCNGAPAYDMTVQDFRLFETGVEVTDFILSCPDPTVRCSQSTALVLDASNSMMGGGNAGAKAGAKAFIDLMDGQTDEAALIWFNHEVTLAQRMTSERQTLVAAVDQLPTSGGTAVWDGAYAGLIELINDGVNQCRTVIVMVDGHDNSSLHTPAAIISLANQHRIRVFCIGLGTSADMLTLEMIALLTGGRYYQSTSAGAQLPAIYGAIETIIAQGYQECSIAYEATGCPDGSMRSVELQLAGFCGGTDIKTKTYRALRDTSAFADLFMDIGEEPAFGDSVATVSLDLLSTVENITLPPFSFFLLHDTNRVLLRSVQTPTGTLLENASIQVQKTGLGSKIDVLDAVVVDGPGTLMEFAFYKKQHDDSSWVAVEAGQWEFTRGCLEAVVANGGIGASPKLDLIPSGTQHICEGDSVTITAPTGFMRYSWSTGENTPGIVVHSSGHYSVSLFDAQNNRSESNTVTVIVWPAPEKPDITATDHVLACDSAASYQWYIDGTPILGATSRQHAAMVYGYYSVEVGNAYGCTVLSDSYPFIANDIDDAAHIDAFELYPDPNNGEVQIALRAKSPVTWDICVTNLLGQVFYQDGEPHRTVHLSRRIDLRSAPPGLYLLRVRAGDQLWTRRMIRR